jgi:hypothetical protein
LNAVLKSKKFDVTVFSRKESTSTFPEGVKVVTTDYSDAELEEKFKGQDAIISLPSGPAIMEQKRYIDAAIKAGVKRFIPSEFGSNTLNNDVVKAAPLFRSKVAISDYLKSKASGEFSYTLFVTGPFLDWVSTCHFLGSDLTSS